MQQVGGACDEGDSHCYQDEGREEYEELLDAASEVFAYHVGQAHAVIAYRKHAGEEVVCGTHEDAAQDYPDVSDRTVCRAEDGSEDGTEAGDVEKLDDEYPPGLHFLVVHPVSQTFGGSGAGG